MTSDENTTSENAPLREEDVKNSLESLEQVGTPVFSEEEIVQNQSDQEQVKEQLEESKPLALDEFREEEDSLEEDLSMRGQLPLIEDLSLRGKIEAVIFASPKPMRTVEIHELIQNEGYTLKEIQDTCDELVEFYRDHAGGFRLKYLKRMGYQFQTASSAKALMEKQFASRPRPLSKAALETLAVIAYRQKQSRGVTRAEVEFIRGVDAGSIFKTLSERNLITCVGRKEIPGRPMMFGVTDEFLKVFQLGSINDLPPLESFQTPPDVLEAANQKIADFEAEMEGVDTTVFINDEGYRSEVETKEVQDPLSDTAPSYSDAFSPHKPDAFGIENSSSVLDSAVDPSGDLEQAADELMDALNEGQVAWAVDETHIDERTIQGATSQSGVNYEENWDEIKSTDDRTRAGEPGDDAAAEVAVPTGDRQSAGSGDLDH